MLGEQDLKIREASLIDDSLIAKHFYQMWRDLDVPDYAIQSDWLETTLRFINQARQELGYKAFVAEVKGTVIGSASCQLFAGLYPNILVPQYQKSGYIWGVYVEPLYRRQGIAKKLTLMTVKHLKSLGCTQSVLNASPLGRSVYSSLGFSPRNEMRLDLS